MISTNHRIIPNILSLRPSATLAINELSHQLIADGKKVFRLGFGQSPFPVPTCVVKALQDHAHEKNYLPVKGLLELREAVASNDRRRQLLERSADDILIGPGSKELLFIAQLCYKGNLLLPAPSWVSYEPQAHLTGKETYWIDTSFEKKKLLSADLLDNFCHRHMDQQFMLVLNYPSNPVGSTYNQDELTALAKVAKKHGVVIISDEIYGEVTHSGAHESIARHYPEGTIISSGLSKWCGAGGWRLGTFSFPKELHWLLESMAVVASETFTSTSTPIQYAAVKAYTFDEEIQSYLTKSNKILYAVAQYTYKTLLQGGLRMPPPMGGFYLFPDFENFRGLLSTRHILSSESLCQHLLEETGVALLPGSAFGMASDQLVTRLAYVDFDGAAAMDALDTSDSNLNEVYVEKYMPNVVEGCNRMINWLM